MRIWHLEPDVPEYNREITDFSDAVRGLAISPDNQTVYSNSDNKMQAWDIKTGKCLATFQYSHNVCGISITSDGRRIVSCVEDGSVQLWDITAATLITTLPGHGSSTLQALSFSDDRYLVPCLDDHTARIWDIKTEKAVAVFEGHDARVNSISLTQDCNPANNRVIGHDHTTLAIARHT